MARTERTTKQVVEDTREHLSELVDAHKELAKAELRAEVQAQVRAIAPIGVAAFLALYVLGFFLVTAAKGIEAAGLSEWVAWLVVSSVLLLVIVVAALVTRSRTKALQRREGPVGGAKVAADVQDTVDWARSQVEGRDGR